MLYFVPVEDLKNHKRLRLKVEVQKWTNMNNIGDFDVEEGI